jgi:hypothetical protein
MMEKTIKIKKMKNQYQNRNRRRLDEGIDIEVGNISTMEMPKKINIRISKNEVSNGSKKS